MDAGILRCRMRVSRPRLAQPEFCEQARVELSFGRGVQCDNDLLHLGALTRDG